MPENDAVVYVSFKFMVTDLWMYGSPHERLILLQLWVRHFVSGISFFLMLLTYAEGIPVKGPCCASQWSILGGETCARHRNIPSRWFQCMVYGAFEMSSSANTILVEFKGGWWIVLLCPLPSRYASSPLREIWLPILYIYRIHQWNAFNLCRGPFHVL